MGLAGGRNRIDGSSSPGRADDDGLLALVFVQGVEDAQHAAGLEVEELRLAVAVGAVAVIHGAAEGRVGLGIAVAADGDVMAGEDPGVLPLVGLPKM